MFVQQLLTLFSRVIRLLFWVKQDWEFILKGTGKWSNATESIRDSWLWHFLGWKLYNCCGFCHRSFFHAYFKVAVSKQSWKSRHPVIPRKFITELVSRTETHCAPRKRPEWSCSKLVRTVKSDLKYHIFKRLHVSFPIQTVTYIATPASLTRHRNTFHGSSWPVLEAFRNIEVKSLRESYATSAVVPSCSWLIFSIHDWIRFVGFGGSPGSLLLQDWNKRPNYLTDSGGQLGPSLLTFMSHHLEKNYKRWYYGVNQLRFYKLMYPTKGYDSSNLLELCITPEYDRSYLWREILHPASTRNECVIVAYHQGDSTGVICGIEWPVLYPCWGMAK